jgi:8-oxo-dGTP pyrophosphatase MutT (NUDIX family)
MNPPRHASWMKVKRLLPGVSAPLFHATTGPRAANIALRGQGLKADTGFSNYGGQVGISMSRDLGLLLRGGFGNVIFVFDGRELEQKFGIAPVQHPSVGDEFEERVDAAKIPASFIRGVIFGGKAPPAFILREWGEKVPYPVLHLSKEEGWKVARLPSAARVAARTAAPFVDEGMVGGNWGSSASGLLITDGERVLLLKRSSSVEDPNLWGIPGGAIPVDYDTHKRKDAKRSALDEAREEMGGIPSGSVGGKHVFRKPSGFTFTTFVWETDRDSLSEFRPRLNWEHTDWGLFDLNDIKPSGIHPGVLWVLKRMGR